MKKFGLIALFFVTIIWGFGFIFVDIALNEITPVQFMFFRFIVASLALIICLNKKILSILSIELKCGTILGVILYISFYLQTEGLNYSTPTKNAFLTSTYVVFVPILVYLFERKRISRTKIFCVLLAILGSGLMVFDSTFRLGLGDTLTIACAIAFALHIYLTTIYLRKCRVMMLVFTQMIVVTIIAFFFALPQGIPTNLSKITIAMIALSGIMATALSYFIQTWAQQYISETTSALILSMESVVGMVASVLILNETITTRMVLGAIIILIAVVCCEMKFKKRDD